MSICSLLRLNRKWQKILFLFSTVMQLLILLIAIYTILFCAFFRFSAQWIIKQNSNQNNEQNVKKMKERKRQRRSNKTVNWGIAWEQANQFVVFFLICSLFIVQASLFCSLFVLPYTFLFMFSFLASLLFLSSFYLVENKTVFFFFPLSSSILGYFNFDFILINIRFNVWN